MFIFNLNVFQKFIENQINELHRPGMVKFQAASTLKKVYPSIGFRKSNFLFIEIFIFELFSSLL